MRFIGVFMVLFSGCLLGFSQAFSYEETIENMKKLAQIIDLLTGQIQTEGDTLPEAICKVSFRQDGNIGDVLQNTAKSIERNEGKELFSIWEEEMSKLHLQLPSKIETEWIHIFDQTGFYDQNGQLKQLIKVQKFMEEEIERMETQKRDKCRLYQSMGFFVSLFVIILLW